MAIYLGIDGGGTKTTCWLGDEHAVLGKGHAGASNIVRVGEEKAREALHSAIHQACSEAGVSAEQIQYTCAGLAGSGRTEIAGAARRILAEVLSGNIEIVGDNVIALQAAFGTGPGVIVIAGTGSIAYGRDAEGHTMRAGGWGFAVSDEGSAHWIGRLLVAEILRTVDGRRDAPLLQDVMRAWHVATFENMVVAANASSQDFATLFPIVLSAANSGDEMAQNILTQAGAELAAVAGVVIRRLFARAKTVPVAMTGGVFAHSPITVKAFYNRVVSEWPDAAVSPNIIEPVAGALERARGQPGAH